MHSAFSLALFSCAILLNLGGFAILLNLGGFAMASRRYKRPNFDGMTVALGAVRVAHGVYVRACE